MTRFWIHFCLSAVATGVGRVASFPALLLIVSCTAPVASAMEDLPGQEIVAEPDASEKMVRLHADWTVDETMPVQWQEATVRALDGWSTVLGFPAYHSATVGPVVEGQMWAVTAANEAPAVGAAGQTIAYDWTSVVFAAGTVSRERPDDDIDSWFSVVVGHEIGHVLMHSEKHAANRDCGIMYKTGDYAVAHGMLLPTDCDADLYFRIWREAGQ